MRIAIIGAGISGMAAGRMLCSSHEVVIFEKSEACGGIARVKKVGDVPYHLVGGHCLNSRHSSVMDFVFQKLAPTVQWQKVDRRAKISFRKHLIDYPIEFAIAQIAQFDLDLAFSMTSDFFASEERAVTNLDDWFRTKFGTTLAQEYFIPYNAKIWGKPPVEMSPMWVEGKLPLPDKQQFFKNLLEPQTDTMPHATFYYPRKNAENEFVEALASGLQIRTGWPVSRLEKVGNRWIVDGEEQFDAVISTMPLNLLPLILPHVPEKVKAAAGRLKYNKVTNMLWETDSVDATWTYFPESSTLFHRHIHIGNFLATTSNHTITETIGVKSYELMEMEGRKIGYLKKPLDYNVSDHAYVVFDQYTSDCVNVIRSYLESLGLHTLGRFGEWEYYNMDVCIASSMRLASCFP